MIVLDITLYLSERIIAIWFCFNSWAYIQYMPQDSSSPYTKYMSPIYILWTYVLKLSVFLYDTNYDLELPSTKEAERNAADESNG